MKRVNLPSFGLPAGFEKLSDRDFEFFDEEPLPKKKTHRGTRGGRRRRRPEHINLQRKAEYRLKILRIRQAAFEEQYYRLRAAQIARDIEADKKWLTEQAERDAARQRVEAEAQNVREYYARALAAEAAKAKRNTTR